MQSTEDLSIRASELLKLLAARKDSTFEKFVRQLMRRKYGLNQVEGVLKDKTLIQKKYKELYVVHDCAKKKLDCVTDLIQNKETSCNKHRIEIDQILQEKHLIVQEINLLEKKVRDNDANVKKIHKNLVQKLKLFKTSISCYVAIDKGDPAVFTLYFFTKQQSSNDNWTLKMKQTDESIELIHTIPKLPRMDKIAAYLAATGDLQGFIHCVYENFRLLQNKSQQQM